jgi:signal transduction histidine kinase
MTRLGALLRRLWPRHLAGQMIALVLLALVLVQLATFLIFADERRLAVRAAARDQILARTALIVRLLAATPPALHDEILRTVSSPRLRFRLDRASLVERPDGDAEAAALQAELQGLLAGARVEQVMVRQIGARRLAGPGRCDDEPEDRADDRRPPPGARPDHAGPDGGRGCPPAVLLAARLPDGQWLNVASGLPPPPRPWPLPYLVSIGLMALAISAIVVVMVRRLTRPLARLAQAAERVGRGEAVGPLPEAGPYDVRQAIEAFNRMQARLGRFVRDRTQALAAISHDLRTPITTLRLRAEFIEDGEIRAKILETLDEMQRMTEATLAFAREEAAVEPTRTVDLAALLESVAADLADLGQDVAVAPAARTPYACRPVALKRAVRNLMENAVRYGQRARLTLAPAAGELRITIDDDGPGIDPADQARVFEPFVRLEGSRSQATGGIGLGLAIARSIVHGHGGEITLENRAAGGLRAAIRLPRERGA